MSEKTLYVALQPFSLSYQKAGKMETVNVKTGEELSFDGLYVEFNGDVGQARSLSKVIGDWIAPVDMGEGQIEETPPPEMTPPSARTRNFSGGREIEQSSPENDMDVRIQQEASHRGEVPQQQAARGRNINGGRVIEDSDVEKEMGVRAPRETSYQELQRLLKVANQKLKDAGITSDLDDIKKEVTVINDDTSEVAKVRHTDTTGVRNTSGVQIKEMKEAKRAVVSQDGMQVKETHYNTKVEEPVQKRLVVDREATGVEVRKTGDYKQAAAVKPAVKKMQVVREEEPVIKTSYAKQKATDVGSSTQPQMEADVIMKSKTLVGGSSNNLKIIRDTQDSDAKVVGKVSSSRQSSLITADNATVTQSGITAKLTVGPEGTVNTGDVQFGSGGDGIELGEVQIGSGGANSTDDGDIDVDSILGQI